MRVRAAAFGVGGGLYVLVLGHVPVSGASPRVWGTRCSMYGTPREHHAPHATR